MSTKKVNLDEQLKRMLEISGMKPEQIIEALQEGRHPTISEYVAMAKCLNNLVSNSSKNREVYATENPPKITFLNGNSKTYITLQVFADVSTKSFMIKYETSGFTVTGISGTRTTHDNDGGSFKCTTIQDAANKIFDLVIKPQIMR